MSIKIPSGPPQSTVLDAVGDVTRSTEAAGQAAETKEAGPAAQDAVSRIAEQVAKGELTRAEAVERIVAEAVDSGIIKSAPDDLSKEMGEVLNSLLETDPYLRSLLDAIGPADRS